MNTQWLKKQVTPEEAEAAHMVRREQLGPDPMPFGFQNALETTPGADAPGR